MDTRTVRFVGFSYQQPGHYEWTKGSPNPILIRLQAGDESLDVSLEVKSFLVKLINTSRELEVEEWRLEVYPVL